MNQRELLSSAEEIISRHKKDSRKSGMEFNIFEVTTVNYHEVLMCKVIAEFIDPRGCHGQGDRYLRLFFQDVLDMKYDGSHKNCEVKKEYRIDNDRRIDIVISSGKLFIPIEVKIYAGDQEGQCCDYLKEAERHGSDVVYYLTRFGSKPSKESYKNEEVLSKVKTVSFVGNIQRWLESCLCEKQPDNLRIILEQLKVAVEKLTNTYVGAGEMEIKELINSPENIEAALKVAASLSGIKADKIKEVFDALETRLTAYLIPSERIITKDDYANKCADFEKGTKFLQLCYRLDEFKISDEEYYAVLVVEIGDNNNENGVLQFGTRVCKKNNVNKLVQIPSGLPENIEKKYMIISDKNNDWLSLKKLMCDGLTVNFRTCDEGYTKLYDSHGFDGIINSFVKQISTEYPDNLPTV